MALTGPREPASASAASSARAGALSWLTAWPVMVNGIARLRGAVPKTLSISGAPASRSGITTRISPGAGASGPASKLSKVSCSTSSSRVSEWQT